MTTRSNAGRSSTARGVALEVLRRIERDGAYANLALGPALDRSGLSERDRGFATDLVYGTTRMRRACDAVVGRFASRAPDDEIAPILRLGAYQLLYAGVAPHAAVNDTVALAPRRSRGFVNAILRRIADFDVRSMTWPSDGARLSYPDWIVRRLRDDLGDDANVALERMNLSPTVHHRDDGYVQDPASGWVAHAVEPEVGERIFDMCAAPGGKATAMAHRGARVLAADRSPQRAGLIAENARRLGLDLPTVVADGTAPPCRAGAFDAVLLDAPCSGLGALRRRPDARWRIRDTDVADLRSIQKSLLFSAAELVRPGGRLVYSVCTLMDEESVDHVAPDGFDIDDSVPPAGTWRRHRQGWRVLPQDADTDGMVMIRYRRRG